MENTYTYWQSAEFPFFVIRQVSFSTFECYDRKTNKWKKYPDGFREVSLNHECHSISKAEANRIVEILRSANTEGMNCKDLCELIR